LDLLSDIGEVAEELAARDELATAAQELSVVGCQLSVGKVPSSGGNPACGVGLTTDNCQLTTASLRARLAEAGRRREYVWLAGRADLLKRCATFGPMAKAQPR
jgi:hypothetical protein